MNNLHNQIKAIVSPSICSQEIADYWFQRLERGRLTRDEGSSSHLCCYFLPYNSEVKEVFIVYHRKSGLWLVPGGHIDQGESLMQTLNREIEEELGVKDQIKQEIQPFLLTITPINRPNHICKEHMDIWYKFATDGSEFKADSREFYQTRWTTISEARKLITDPPNLEALSRIEKLFLD